MRVRQCFVSLAHAHTLTFLTTKKYQERRNFLNTATKF